MSFLAISKKHSIVFTEQVWMNWIHSLNEFNVSQKLIKLIELSITKAFVKVIVEG